MRNARFGPAVAKKEKWPPQATNKKRPEKGILCTIKKMHPDMCGDLDEYNEIKRQYEQKTIINPLRKPNKRSVINNEKK